MAVWNHDAGRRSICPGDVLTGGGEVSKRGSQGASRGPNSRFQTYNAPMPSNDTRVLQGHESWRRSFEIGFWIIQYLVSAVGNTLTVNMDVERLELGFADWQPAVWEGSSALMSLALVPVMVWWTRRVPFHVDTWRRALPLHVLGSLVWSALHVTGMVLIRKAAYTSQGLHYDFSPWLWEFGYEYLKDVRTYAGIVLTIEAYRLLKRRLQGEASLLSAPDEGPPVEPVDRPQRFLVRKLGKEFLVSASDIEWLQASGNYVNLHVRGRDYPLRSTLAGIEARLDPDKFQRIHRSYMVNLNQVTSIEPLESGDAKIHLKEGGSLPCSRTFRSSLRHRLGLNA